MEENTTATITSQMLEGTFNCFKLLYIYKYIFNCIMVFYHYAKINTIGIFKRP